MLDVRVGFSTTNKWQSRIIRWLTKAPCSHAWLSFYDDTLRMRLVMQAEVWGYELRPWRRWQHENTLVEQFLFKEGGRELALPLREVAENLGTKYDFKAALWVGIVGWFKRWLKARLTFRPSRTPKKLMCSESVIRFLNAAGYFLPPHFDPELTSPGELLQYCQASLHLEKVEDK